MGSDWLASLTSRNTKSTKAGNLRALESCGCTEHGEEHGEGAETPSAGWRATHIDPYDMALVCTDAPVHFFVGEFRARSVVGRCRAPFLEVGLFLRQLVGRAETPVGVSRLHGSDQYVARSKERWVRASSRWFARSRYRSRRCDWAEMNRRGE